MTQTLVWNQSMFIKDNMNLRTILVIIQENANLYFGSWKKKSMNVKFLFSSFQFRILALWWPNANDDIQRKISTGIKCIYHLIRVVKRSHCSIGMVMSMVKFIISIQETFGIYWQNSYADISVLKMMHINIKLLTKILSW